MYYNWRDVMLNKSEIAEIMSKKTGIEIKEDLVVLLPDDGTPGHMGSGHWNVYAARAGEFTVLAYAFDTGEVSVRIV